MFARNRLALLGALVILFLPAGTLAQANGPEPRAEATPVAAGAANAGLITPDVIRAWNRISQTVLSADGRWFAYALTPNEGDVTVVYRGTARNAPETRVNAGDGGGSIAISDDSKWLGFIVAPPKPPEGARSNRRGAPRGEEEAAADSTAEQPTSNKFVLVNLTTGEKKEFERIRRFSFNGENSTWVAMMGYGTPETPAAGNARGAAARGSNGAGAPGGGASAAAPLLLYHLATGELFNMGVVGDYAFDEDGRWLAYTMETPDRVGNGVQLRDMSTNVARSLESDRLLYSHLAWVDSSRALSVMRGRIDRESNDTIFSIRVFRRISERGAGETLTFEPEAASGFPEGWKLASERAPRYADDMSAVYFGIREVKEKEPVSNGVRAGAPGMGGSIERSVGGARGGTGESADTALPSLILWHHRDPRLQSQQIVQEQLDRTFNYFSAYRFRDRRFMQLADDAVRTVNVLPGDRWAYGTSNDAYQHAASYSGRNYMDVYRFDLRSGERTLLMQKRPSGALTPSPDGRNLLFWGVDGHYWVLDIASGDSVNITQNVPVSFVDVEDDHNNIHPRALPARGWARDGSAVLLYDDWDLWKVPVRTGEPAVNLTGDGREKQIRYQRIYDFSADQAPGGFRFGGGAGNEGIDLSKPLWIGMYGEWTKMEGLARVNPRQPGANVLFFEPARFSVQKARDADTFIYTRQTATEFPNYWVASASFRDSHQITDANPQIRNLAWSSGTRLIEYTTDRGVKLQGALYLPANYEPGTKYPLLVTIYERRSQNLNSFVSPSETRAPDPSQYTNRGYAVLDPDIVYEINDPGMSAVWAVIPAVKAAIATGIVDESKVGLWGHSWGGYQTAFLVTQTNIFRAAVAGAPLTDMVSMYSSVYWNTGGTNQAIFEASQGRFKGNYIENYDAYIRNSPAFHADKVTTPLIILHNEKDGAVDFNQGITYFNTLRQLGKEVILLQYVGENHGLRVEANQKDYATRMAEWFDHFLLGRPAPDWMKNGIPRLEMEEHLRSRRNPATTVTTANDH
ncbi:MAG TPA: prolyl oligopeptidase family serine peptidase [Longimicrobiales bacterium]